jgi:diketogulonate reductase-like aldo/keto reductase
MEKLILNNNIEIPILGFGTYRLTGNTVVEKAILTALEVGYRHIDTASVYENEIDIGFALQKSKIKREELFLTTKVWNSDQGYHNTLKAFDRSLNKLSTDYLDLYLIHWAVKGKYTETWGAMEELYNKGLIKSIGVSNFHINHLNDLFSIFTIKPAVNQIELHPYLSQNEIRSFCNHNNIQVESWSPIAKGRILNDNVIVKLSEKYKKTPAQIVIRWHIENKLIVIPKSATKERIKENFNVFDFSLSDEDLKLIDLLNSNTRIGPDPDNFDF